MRIWIDAQLPPSLALRLSEEFGLAAQHILELGLVSAKDEEIYRLAGKAGAIVITKDSDFVRLLEQHGQPPKILWITLGNVTNADLWSTLAAHWPQIREHFEAGEPLVELGPTS